MCAMAFSGNAFAQMWADKEEQIGKELYIPEIKLVKPSEMPGGLSRLLQDRMIDILHVEQRVNPGKYSCTPISGDDRSRALSVLAGALEKIPAQTMRKAKLKYVLLCDESYAQGTVIGGIPIPPLKLLMLSMGGAQSEYQEHIFFHEFYHYMEFVAGRNIQDSVWNARFSGYGSNTSDWALGSGAKDFVSAYGQTKPEEDRAEIFAHMMHDPDGFANYIKMQGSDVLTQKAAYIRSKAINEFGIDSLKR